MEKFEDLIQSPTPILIDFFAEWCGPCKMMKPILEELKKEVGEMVRIVKIDIDKKSDLADRYKIQSVPTLMIFREGQQLWRASGVMQVKELKEILKRYEKKE